MKYLIQPLGSKPSVCSAQGDAIQIAIDCDYKPFYIRTTHKKSIVGKVIDNVIRLCTVLYLWLKLKSSDTVFMQWPVSFGHSFPVYLSMLKKKQLPVTVLVHDIDILREVGGGKNFEHSLQLFGVATRVILHSEAMKQFIVQHGIDSDKIAILECFDYLTKDEITRPAENSKDVVFVGQLDKSAFLEHISPARLDFHLNLYGRFEKDLGPCVTYKSTFRSDNVSIFEGSWGLVWNGDTIDECTGPMGEYLRYNAPHKVSLFIAAQLPIIIWDKAAKAEYVRRKGIGICVSSLREIGKRIEGITPAQYQQMLDNIKIESMKVRDGLNLRSFLD